MKDTSCFTFEIVEPVLSNEKKIFKDFSEKNWGEHDNTGEENDFFGTPTFCLIARDGENLVGLAFCYVRDLVFKNESICYGAIGGVVTHKDYRHKGIATNVVERIVEELRLREVDISILCTNIQELGKLYAQIGFVPLGRPYYFLNKVGETKSDAEGMIAPCASDEKFRMILNSNEKLYTGISNF